MEIKDCVALITGGASGLGAATARALGARGARLAILDLSGDAGEALARELGNGSIFVRTDVTDSAAVSAAVEQAARLGPLRILVNCAGIATAGKVLGREGPLPLEPFARTISINLIGTFNCIRLAAAAIVANEPDSEGERGVIINTASVAAFDGQIGQAAYSASKAGVAGMTLPVARELAQSGIRVVTIAPGIFETPMLAGLPEKARQSLGQQVPFPSRLGRPEEYAALAVHIVENRMLNGETIRLDGALRMGPR